jgi:hypothetical protein
MFSQTHNVLQCYAHFWESTSRGIVGAALRLVRARRGMNKAEELETCSAFVSSVAETIAFSSVVTKRRSRQIQDLTTDALELNRAIVGRGISRNTRYGVDHPVASPVRA